MILTLGITQPTNYALLSLSSIFMFGEYSDEIDLPL